MSFKHCLLGFHYLPHIQSAKSESQTVFLNCKFKWQFIDQVYWKFSVLGIHQCLWVYSFIFSLPLPFSLLPPSSHSFSLSTCISHQKDQNCFKWNKTLISVGRTHGQTLNPRPYLSVSSFFLLSPSPWSCPKEETLFESILKSWFRFVRNTYPVSAREVPASSVLVTPHKTTIWHSYHVWYLLNVCFAPISILWASPLNSGTIIILFALWKELKFMGGNSDLLRAEGQTG